jgi:TonB family protein
MPTGALTTLTVIALVVAGCSDRSSGDARGTSSNRQPDERPVMVNDEPPFHYPVALYARKLQGNVTLGLFIDVSGLVVGDSTRVEQTSGYAAFDSAAVVGAQSLRFVPAKLRGEPIAMKILFPVYFRHPEAPALPGDSILHHGRAGSGS